LVVVAAACNDSFETIAFHVYAILVFASTLEDALSKG
jgi:hypothetical protein